MYSEVKKEDLEAVAVYTEQLRKKPKLIYLFFELTDACNLFCLHCGSSASPERRKYLDWKSIQRVLDRVADTYEPTEIMICLSGGEPMLHPDFFRIISYARSLGFRCGVTTNGTFITPDVARKLLESRIDSVTFSLDGLRDSHNYLRNRPWAYDRTVEGIRNLTAVSRGRIAIQTTTVIHRKNFCELDRLYRLMTELAVDSWRIVNMEPIGRALENQELDLTPDQLCGLLDFIKEKRFDPETRMEVTFGCSHYLGLEYERMVRRGYFICGSGICVASVLCNGDIYSCMDIERRPELVQGNIYRDDFVDVWEHQFQAFRRDRSEDSEICRDCEHRRFCRGDAAHTWDYDRERPRLCIKIYKEVTQ